VRKILFVDDEAGIRKVAGRFLSKEGFGVRTAESAGEALDILGSEEFDLIMTDKRMPVMDGEALVKEIREKGIETPIIMIAGSISPDGTKGGAEKNGCQGFMTKPVQLFELLAEVKRVLNVQ